jgi:hypothetical protein
MKRVVRARESKTTCGGRGWCTHLSPFSATVMLSFAGLASMTLYSWAFSRACGANAATRDEMT